MFTPKEYTLVCHGCGRVHKIVSSFISVPIMIEFAFADGRRIIYPQYGCAECVSRKLPREESSLYLAYKNGMSIEAYNRAAAALGALPRDPKDDRSIPCSICQRSGHLRADGMHELCFRRQRDLGVEKARKMAARGL